MRKNFFLARANHALSLCTLQTVKAIQLIVFLLAMLSFTPAAQCAGQPKVTYQAREVPLKNVLEEIHKQTGINIVCSDVVFSSTKPVSISFHNAELAEVLEVLFTDQPLTYVLVGQTLFVKASLFPWKGLFSYVLFSFLAAICFNNIRQLQKRHLAQHRYQQYTYGNICMVLTIAGIAVIMYFFNRYHSLLQTVHPLLYILIIAVLLAVLTRTVISALKRSTVARALLTIVFFAWFGTLFIAAKLSGESDFIWMLCLPALCLGLSLIGTKK